MNRYGTMPEGIRTTFKDALTNQATYDLVSKKSDGENSALTGPASGGVGFSIFAVVICIIGAIFSLFFSAEEAESDAAPVNADESGAHA